MGHLRPPHRQPRPRRGDPFRLRLRDPRGVRNMGRLRPRRAPHRHAGRAADSRVTQRIRQRGGGEWEGKRG
uniref:Uncharacterized protein n=1 Tax=Arundo donax TaxID=35708 RepID=A0A0A9E592_ARUDO